MIDNTERVDEKQNRKRRGRKKVPAFRRKRRNVLGISIAVITMVVLITVMFYGFRDLSSKRAELKARAEQLQTKIDDENARTEKLEQYETYTHTKKFAEETAKDMLGYVYEDEIVFKLDN